MMPQDRQNEEPSGDELHRSLQGVLWRAAVNALLHPAGAAEWGYTPKTPDEVEQHFGKEAREVYEALNEQLEKVAEISTKISNGEFLVGEK